MAAPETTELAPPRLWLKLGFCIVLGMLSTAFAEVVAGSTPFPFLNPWGNLVVTPLYTLHIVVLATVLVRFRMLTWQGLCLAGALFGLYEAYITKVLFSPPWGQEIALSLAGVAWAHVVLLALFWHALLAFFVPLLLAEVLLTRSRSVLGVLPDRVRVALTNRRRPVYWIAAFAVGCGLSTSGNAASIPITVGSILFNGALLFLLVWTWRARVNGTRYRLEDLLPGCRGLVVWCVLLGLFYLVTGAILRTDSLPGPAGHVAMGALYVALGAALFRCRTLYHEAPSLLETVPSRSIPWHSFLAFIAIYGTVPRVPGSR